MCPHEAPLSSFFLAFCKRGVAIPFQRRPKAPWHDDYLSPDLKLSSRSYRCRTTVLSSQLGMMLFANEKTEKNACGGRLYVGFPAW